MKCTTNDEMFKTFHIPPTRQNEFEEVQHINKAKNIGQGKIAKIG